VIDKYQNRYHSGIKGYTTSIEETVDLLKEKIKGYTTSIDETVDLLKEKIKGYKYVHFLGVSAGGYAAILFGSLLNVTTIISFVAPTLCNTTLVHTINYTYYDLQPFINNKTKYYLHVDSNIANKNDPHHMSQNTRLKRQNNIKIVTIHDINLPKMRDTGELTKLISDCVNNT